MLQQVSSLFVLLHRHSASIFERDNGGCKVRDMLFGPFNLEPGISVSCTHGGGQYHNRLAMYILAVDPAHPCKFAFATYISLHEEKATLADLFTHPFEGITQIWRLLRKGGRHGNFAGKQIPHHRSQKTRPGSG